MKTHVVRFVFNDFSVNTYLIWHETHNQAVVIDPGMQNELERDRFVKYLSDKRLIPTAILLTHGHFDHILGVEYLKTKYNVKVYSHKHDQFLIEDAPQVAQMYGISGDFFAQADYYLNGSSSLELANIHIEVLHTPGHSPGHLSFYLPESEFVFTGDTLFRGTIGRTDLPGGDLDALMDSLWRKVLVLPPAARVFPGHGLPTTIADEKNSNPFLK